AAGPHRRHRDDDPKVRLRPCHDPRATVRFAVLLSQVIARLPVVAVRGSTDVVVSRVDHDSRRVGPGSLFCCVTGAQVDGPRFAAAVFTNLTPDHLDFHGDMAVYFAAKARLFTPELTDRGIVNVDDDYGRRLEKEAGVPVTGYGLADARDLSVQADGST